MELRSRVVERLAQGDVAASLHKELPGFYCLVMPGGIQDGYVVVEVYLLGPHYSRAGGDPWRGMEEFAVRVHRLLVGRGGVLQETDVSPSPAPTSDKGRACMLLVGLGTSSGLGGP